MCLPSLAEGAPCSILEGMALGLPVIATTVGGIPEIVLREQTGLLVPPENIPELSEAIQQLISQPELRVKLGAQGYTHYTRTNHPDVLVEEKLIPAYQLLLGNP